MNPCIEMSAFFFFLRMDVSLRVCTLCLLRKGAHNHVTSITGIVRRWHANMIQQHDTARNCVQSQFLAGGSSIDP